jgi:hypothetical protein
VQFTLLGLIEKNFLKTSCLNPDVNLGDCFSCALADGSRKPLALAPWIPQREKIEELSGLINILTFSRPWDRVSESRNCFVES